MLRARYLGSVVATADRVVEAAFLLDDAVDINIVLREFVLKHNLP